jgi:hypothetical protein
VLLAHPVAQYLADQRRQADLGITQQPAGQLGVEDGTGHHADLRQAGQVLVGGVDDPLRVHDGVAEHGQIAERDRVDERRAGPGTTQLDQIRAV